MKKLTKARESGKKHSGEALIPTYKDAKKLDQERLDRLKAKQVQELLQRPTSQVKRPLRPYFFFSKEQRPKVMAENPECSLGGHSKLIG